MGCGRSDRLFDRDSVVHLSTIRHRVIGGRGLTALTAGGQARPQPDLEDGSLESISSHFSQASSARRRLSSLIEKRKDGKLFPGKAELARRNFLCKWWERCRLLGNNFVVTQ